MSEYQEVPPDHPAGFDDPGQPASEHHHDQNENVAGAGFFSPICWLLPIDSC